MRTFYTILLIATAHALLINSIGFIFEIGKLYDKWHNCTKKRKR